MEQYWYKPNKVSAYQKVFQGGPELPVFLRGRSDRLMYRSIMVASVMGIGLTYFCIYQMASGQMKKKGPN
jgi:hypothetical protein